MTITGIFHGLMLAATIFSSRFLGKETTSVNHDNKEPELALYVTRSKS